MVTVTVSTRINNVSPIDIKLIMLCVSIYYIIRMVTRLRLHGYLFVFVKIKIRIPAANSNRIPTPVSMPIKRPLSPCPNPKSIKCFLSEIMSLNTWHRRGN